MQCDAKKDDATTAMMQMPRKMTPRSPDNIVNAQHIHNIWNVNSEREGLKQRVAQIPIIAYGGAWSLQAVQANHSMLRMIGQIAFKLDMI
jgi:hypothetical protein